MDRIAALLLAVYDEDDGGRMFDMYLRFLVLWETETAISAKS
jgi:hypothetical protein